MARLSGDEFVVLAQNLSDPNLSTSIAEKLLQAFRAPIERSAGAHFVPTSIGVALYPEHREGANTLLRNADAAMYAAKHGRRNDFAFYTHALTDHARERVRLEHDRHVAIDERQLEFYLQPQVSLTDTRIVGAELLLRWHHPTRG